MLVCASQAYCFQDPSSYKRYLDSAETNLSTNTALSKIYLDSIVNPSEKNLKEHIAKYYYLKAKLEYEDYGIAATLQNYIKSLTYADKYKEFRIGAKASSEIASSFYLSKKDSLASVYYQKAVGYYTKIDDREGLLDLMQFPAYAKYANFEAQESIDLVLKDLETYKNVEGDKMYYSFAIFLLASNYVHLNDLKRAHYYNAIYESLEGNEYIEPNYYLKYDNAINMCFAEYYYENKNLDSLKIYLDAVNLKKGSRDFNIQKSVYTNYIEYYRLTGNTPKEKLYMDSLRLFNEGILENTLETSLAINDDLSKTNIKLSEETAAKKRNISYKYVFLIIAVILGILVFMYFRKNKNKESAFSELKTKFTLLKSKQEKLAVKNIEFEEFLTTVRKEIRRISALNTVAEKQANISKLYKEIHLNRDNFVNSEDHYKLLSSLNESFFTEIEKRYPELDNLEVQICYYLFTGFKNKEIAMFTDRSLRAVEGKRYRIVKKLEIDSEKEGLKDFLERIFEKY